LKQPHDLIKDIYVETPTAKRVITELEMLRLYGRQNDWSECLLLAGPSRVGKTAVVRHYSQRFPERMEGRQLIRPVLLVRLNADTRLHSLISATPRAMGDPRSDHGTPGARTDHALRIMNLQQIEVLIYDEFQHLIDFDTDKIAYKAWDTVKSILNAGKSRVMSGVTHAERVLHTNSQLIGRTRTSVYIDLTDWRDPNQRLEFRSS
jgi:Bacterial TniB protein